MQLRLSEELALQHGADFNLEQFVYKKEKEILR